MKRYQQFDINYYQDEEGIFTAQVPAIRGHGVGTARKSDFLSAEQEQIREILIAGCRR